MASLNFKILATSLVLSSIALGGCKNSPPVTSGVGVDQMTQHDNFSKHLQTHNADLAKKLRISDVKTRTNNDLLEVALTLNSNYKKSLQLQYHFIWFDEDGFVVEEGKSPWKPLELHGMQTASVKGLSPTVKAKSFSIYVRNVPETYYKF
jgi:uncharacterized protein YcfL